MRALTVLHALLSSLLASALLGPLAGTVGPEAALPALGLLSAALVLLLAPLLSSERRPPGPLEMAALVGAGLPAAAIALPLSSAAPGRALLALAVLGFLGLVAIALARLGRPARMLAAGGLLGLSVTLYLLRFTATAIHGEERGALRLLSPLEIVGAALAPEGGPPGPAATLGTPRANEEGVTVESGTAGLFRRGVPVPLSVSAPYVVGGESPWFEALEAGPLFPSFHDRPSVGGRIDWQPVEPDERLRFVARPGKPERRRMPDGWALTAPAAPTALAVLEAFDDLPAPDPAWRALRAARGEGPRPLDAALDPDLYASLEPPVFPPALLSRAAALALALGLAAVLIQGPLLLRRRRRPASGYALLASLALGLAGGALAGAHRPRAVLLEGAVLVVLPGESGAARIDEIEVGAPRVTAEPSFDASGAPGLTPILFRRPEPLPYEVVRERGREGVRRLRLPPGGRRLFRALAPHALAGPLERAGARIVNRSGLSFLEWFEVGRDRARRGGPIEDGALQGEALHEGSRFTVLGALDARGASGRSLRSRIERLTRPSTASGRKALVLLARDPLESRLVAADALAHERLPALVLVPLPE